MDPLAPSAAAFAAMFCSMSASTVSSRSVSVTLSGQGDPGYHFTAVGLAEMGLCLAGKVGGGR